MTTAQQSLTGPCSPPPCSAADIDPLLNEDYANAVNPKPEPPRCRFLSSDKRQCRMLRADRHPDFCLYHAARQEEIFALLPEREFDLSPELVTLAADLTTATGVNRALAEVFRLLAKKHISRKDAVAFGYIAQLLLQTVPGVRAEAADPVRIAAVSEQRESKGRTDSLPAADPATSHPEAAAASEASLNSRSIPKKPSPQDTNAPADPLPQSEPLTLSSRVSGEGSLSSGSIPKKPSPPATDVTTSAISSPANTSASSAFCRPNYADLLNRSLDLFQGRIEASPESQREARRLLRELEQLEPARVAAAESNQTSPRVRPQTAPATPVEYALTEIRT